MGSFEILALVVALLFSCGLLIIDLKVNCNLYSIKVKLKEKDSENLERIADILADMNVHYD